LLSVLTNNVANLCGALVAAVDPPAGGAMGLGGPAGGIGTGPWTAALIPLLPLLSFALCALCAALRIKSKLPAWITVVSIGGAFALTVHTYIGVNAGGLAPVITHLFEWLNFKWGTAPGQHFIADFGFYLDSLTCLWMLFVTGLATLIALYASEYMSHDVGAGYCRFFAAFSLFVFSMACLVMGDNLILLYLGWEGVGLCSYLLIGYFYKKPSAVAAAKKAFIVNRIGDLFLALGIMLCWVHFGSVEYKVIFEKAAPYVQLVLDGKLEQIPAIAQLIPLLLMVGAFGKSAQLPLYVWLPDAMEGPTPVSALIHAATMVTAGVYLIARTYPLFLLSEYALPIVGWVGALTALLAATIGMAQFDIKRIMAYSTVSQLGYMFAGLAVLGSTGAAAHVFTHAFFKAMLFLACGAVMHGFAGQLDLRKLSGVGSMPGWRIVGIAMLVGCLNLAGFPLITAGYWSKDMILGDAFANPQMQMIGWILLLTAGLTAYYTFRVYFRVFAGPQYYEPGDELHSHGDEHGHDDGHHHGHVHGHAGHTPATGEHKHSEHKSGHDAHFHPHPPGWAINTVLAVLAIAAFAAIIPLKMGGGEHKLPGGWVGNMVASSSANFPGSAAYLEHSDSSHSHTGTSASRTTPKVIAPAGEQSAHEASHAGHAGHGLHATFFGYDAHIAMMYVSAVVGAIGIFFAYILHYAGRTTAAKSKADALLPAVGPLAHWAQRKWYVDELYDLLIVKPLWILSNIFALLDKYLVDGIVDLLGWIPRALGKTLRPSQSGDLHGYALGMAGGVALLLVVILLVTLR
jgi:NADH-quinone oxidoreductase subunit L